MRFTLQVWTADDYAALRSDLQPALSRNLRAFVGKRIAGLDPAPVLALARSALEERPLTFAELRELLAERFPDWDTPALACRYLAAFGPASVRDVQTWSGLTGLRAAAKELEPELVRLRDEQGNELLDLPGAPLPEPETPTPPLLLPDYDNAILSHADRARIVPPEHRSKVFVGAGRVLATFLVDGFVAGTWKFEREGKRRSTLLIEPFGRLAKADRATLADEGERLLRFAEGDAAAAVRFGDA